MDAGLAWVDAGSGQVMVATRRRAGAMTGAPVAASSSSGAPFSCLGFSPGKDDLTVALLRRYHRAGEPRTGLGHRRGRAKRARSIRPPCSASARPHGPGALGLAHRRPGTASPGRTPTGDWLAEYGTQADVALDVVPVRLGRTGFGGAESAAAHRGPGALRDRLRRAARASARRRALAADDDREPPGRGPRSSRRSTGPSGACRRSRRRRRWLVAPWWRPTPTTPARPGAAACLAGGRLFVNAVCY